MAARARRPTSRRRSARCCGEERVPTTSPALTLGVDLFNAARFWEAHEAWEEIWLTAAGDEKRYLQGLIQLAAAYHHVQRGTYSGGVRLFDAAMRKLEGFSAMHSGIDRRDAIAAATLHRDRIARGEAVDPSEFPKLRMDVI